MTLIIAKPADCDQPTLQEELRAQLDRAAFVDLGDGTLEFAGLTDDDRAAVEAIIAAHVPPAPGANPHERVHAALQAEAGISAETRDALCALLCPE